MQGFGRFHRQRLFPTRTRTSDKAVNVPHYSGPADDIKIRSFCGSTERNPWISKKLAVRSPINSSRYSKSRIAVKSARFETALFRCRTTQPGEYTRRVLRATQAGYHMQAERLLKSASSETASLVQGAPAESGASSLAGPGPSGDHRPRSSGVRCRGNSIQCQWAFPDRPRRPRRSQNLSGPRSTGR